MSTTTQQQHALLRALSTVTILLAALILTLSLTPAPAAAETPAERCKRETTAYNNAWKNTWAQANPGKKPSDAPPPPVPYKCGGNNDGPPPTVSPSDSTPSKPDKKGEPTKSAPKDDSGPKLNPPSERNDNENGVNPEQPVIPHQPGSDCPSNRAEFTTWYTGADGRRFAVYALSQAEAIAKNLISETTKYLRQKPGPVMNLTLSRKNADAQAPVSCYEHHPEKTFARRSGVLALVGTGDAYWCGDGQWVRQWAKSECGGKAYWPTYKFNGCKAVDLAGVNYNLYQVNYRWEMCAANPTARILDTCLYNVVGEQDWQYQPNGAAVLTRDWSNR